MKFGLAISVLSSLASRDTVNGLEIRRISDPIPAERSARRVKVSGDGDCFVYEGDMEYQYLNNTAFGDNRKHIWMTCGVFSNNKTHTLLSVPDAESKGSRDDNFPVISDSGTSVCYYTKDLSGSIITLVNSEAQPISNIFQMKNNGTKSSYCDISPDGGTVVFQSDANLVPGVEGVKYQIYSSSDSGKTFNLVAGKEIAENPSVSLLSSYPQLSKNGKFVTFQAKMPFGDSDAVLKTNELFLSRSSDNELVRITDFNDNYCNLTVVFEKMKEHWGEANLTAEGITKATNTQCNLGATLGWFKETDTIGAGYSHNLLGAGHGPARISNNGRFIAFTAGFDHSNIRGVHEKRQIITAANLFLHDTVLGLTWQITKEGDAGSSDFERRVEDFCCPSASATKQRGTCSKSNEYKGFCCWQRPCWFPAQWPDISGDGSSIAFFSSYGHGGALEVYGDNELYHYHIPTGKLTVVTNTTNKDHDDTYPSISYSGEVISWESDFDYKDDVPIISNNQVFAAKLTYGCLNELGSNFVVNPDVQVNCVYDNIGYPYVSEGHGVKLTLKGKVNKMLKNVPFYSVSKRKEKVKKRKKLCDAYQNDVLVGLALALQIPTEFLDPYPFVKKCMRKRFGKKPVVMKISFKKTVGSSFKAGTWFAELQAQMKNPASDLSNGYLTRTIVSIENEAF